MTTIQSIQNFEIHPTLPKIDSASYWTDIKIKQVSLYVFSGISLVSAGIILASASPLSLSLAAAIPLAIASGTLFYYASHLIDYENPQTVAALRKEALLAPLQELIKKHGWEKLFLHAILEPSDFDSAYRCYAKTISFKEILTLYKEAKRTLDQIKRQDVYTLPSPAEWKDLFQKETQEMRCDEIVKKYPIGELKAFPILNSKQLELLAQSEIALHEFDREEIALEKQFIERTNDERVFFQNLKEGARLSYLSHPSHTTIARMDADTKIAIDFCRNNAKALIRQEEQSVTFFKDRLLEARKEQILSADDLKEIAMREDLKQKAISRIRNNEYETISYIQAQAKLHKIPLETSLAIARNQRDISIRQAQDRFDRYVLPIRKEIDKRHEQNKDIYNKKITEITKYYHKLY